MRIHVTRNAGVGKTTMTRHLADEFNLPVYHLDKFVSLYILLPSQNATIIT